MASEEPIDEPIESEATDEEDDFSDFEDFDADWDLEDEDASKLLRGLEALIPGIIKRSVISGLSNLGDEGLKGVTEKNIPKEAVGFVLTSADATRKEILRIVSREIRIFLENMDFGGEIAKILTTLSFEIRTEIRFVPNDEKVKPNVRNRVKLKRRREDGEEETLSDYTEEIGVTDEEISEASSSKGKKRRWTRKKTKTDSDEPIE